MADQTREHLEPDNPDVHHEESDINVRAVLIGAAIVAVFAVFTTIGLWGMFVGFRKIDRSLDPAAPSRIEQPPSAARELAPDFTVHWSEPAKYLEAIQTENREVLEEYGWVDRPNGTVHVPIEVGMQMALERGYPTRTSPAVPAGESERAEPLGDGVEGVTTASGSELREPSVGAEPQESGGDR